jgi:ADP-ribose pyrophosphatase YjhB (NUDIX family)
MTPNTSASSPESSNPVAAFAAWFMGLSEAERFAAGKAFRTQTGGTLSGWSNPLPVGVAVVPVLSEDGTRVGLLGVRRAIEPAKGTVVLPGGFAMLGEDPSGNVAREVHEETGIRIDPAAFTAIDGLPRLAHNGGWLCFLRCETVLPYEAVAQANAQLAAAGDGEASEVVWVEPGQTLGFPLHSDAASRFFAEQAAAPRLTPDTGALRSEPEGTATGARRRSPR